MTLGKLLSFSVPRCLNLSNGDNRGIYLRGLLGRLDAFGCVKHVEQGLAQGEPKTTLFLCWRNPSSLGSSRSRE